MAARMQRLKEKILTISDNLVIAIKERRKGKPETISNGMCQKSRYSSSSNEEKGRFFRSFDEYKFLICVLCFSTSVVVFKVLYANRENFRKIYIRGKKLLNAPDSLTDYGILPQLSAGFASIWSVVVDLNWLFIPAVVGIATTFITWRFVYWDSRIPGIQPRSPFSTEAQRKKAPFIGSSGYTFALFVGILVFLVLLVQWALVST